jgi:hypothetical protein
MTHRHLIAVFGIVVGLGGAMAVRQWPDHEVVVQMTFYSTVVLGLLVLGLWPDRDRPRYWAGMLLVFLLHGITLLLARPLFPFTTVLTVVPLALAEGAFLFALMIGLLGGNSS